MRSSPIDPRNAPRTLRITGISARFTVRHTTRRRIEYADVAESSTHSNRYTVYIDCPISQQTDTRNWIALLVKYRWERSTSTDNANLAPWPPSPDRSIKEYDFLLLRPTKTEGVYTRVGLMRSRLRIERRSIKRLSPFWDTRTVFVE
jgi:hypothetical protein